MYKINLISKDWELINVINVNAIPREGDYVFIEADNVYYLVGMVVHNIVKGRFRNKAVISIVVSRVNQKKE